MSEEQRKRYERTLPYLKAEKAKRGGNGGKISVEENGKTFTVEGKLTNEQIKFVLFGNEDGRRHAHLTIDSIDQLNEKLKKHLEWSNNKVMRTLGNKSPIQILNEKLAV